MAALSSIDLTFDAASEATLRGEWDALERAGFSSLGAHRATTNRPHLTLVVGTPLDLVGRPTVDALPLPLTIGAPVLFGSGDRRVLARLVTPTSALLDLQAVVHASVRQDGLAAHSHPGAWIGHVTLARRIRLDDVAQALGLLGNDIIAEATALRLWNAAERTVTLLA
ncbi:2'-5' RNA ligase family protein [Agreia sp.]|uniref:2'-5' RNA ligase family protein n=1 Tax=Agreia sp. TaxID=1872416 RepID=UPI0035BBE9BB